MKTFLKKNWLLITAFALPLLIIMGVVISIYIPQSKIVPQYDFVYATCVDEYYYCDAYIEEFYGVENEKFVVREMSTLRDADNNNIPDVDEEKWGKGIQIYRYDVTTDSPQEITKEEAKKYILDDEIYSPDGLRFSRERTGYGGGILDIADVVRSEYRFYLINQEGVKKEINVADGSPDFIRRQKHFIGWIVNKQ
tara:strand:- start:794 stop:1378 length:585 start_codon:yes stop_codon:yes gene_type:complete